MLAPFIDGEPFSHVSRVFAALQQRAENARLLRVTSPEALVAFSHREERLPGYMEAAKRARDHGYIPLLRPVGGTFAPMDSGSIVVEEFGYTTEGEWPQNRYQRHAELLCEVYRSFGADAHIGEVLDEYCPGRYSIHRAGEVKISGTAQRVSKRAWLVSTTVRVTSAGPLRPVIAACAQAFGTDVDPMRAGALIEDGDDESVLDVASAVLRHFVQDGVAPISLVTERATRSVGQDAVLRQPRGCADNQDAVPH